MSKMINLDYEGTTYTLEMTRASVQTMEKNGFRVGEVMDQPVTMIPELVYGAFITHHRGIQRSLVDEIYASLEGKEEFIKALLEMYQETLETLTAEPPKNGKNASWKMRK